jgi:hypothetical protein
LSSGRKREKKRSPAGRREGGGGWRWSECGREYVYFPPGRREEMTGGVREVR